MVNHDLFNDLLFSQKYAMYTRCCFNCSDASSRSDASSHKLIIFSEESNIGLLYSSVRNVGKSETLTLLAKAQGLPADRCHPLLCSGGDQRVSGTSMYVYKNTLP
jgi:hypothetical protein